MAKAYRCDSGGNIVHAHDSGSLKDARYGGSETALESRAPFCARRLALDQELPGAAFAVPMSSALERGPMR
jgi:hypothetical protein